MTIIPSNMIGHFLVHSTILPSRSSPSALVAEVEKAPCRPIEELLRETWRTFPLSPIDPRNDEDKRRRQEYWQWCWYWLKLVLWMFSKMGEHHTPTPFSTHSHSHSFFICCLSTFSMNIFLHQKILRVQYKHTSTSVQEEIRSINATVVSNFN